MYGVATTKRRRWLCRLHRPKHRRLPLIHLSSTCRVRDSRLDNRSRRRHTQTRRQTIKRCRRHSQCRYSHSRRHRNRRHNRKRPHQPNHHPNINEATFPFQFFNVALSLSRLVSLFFFPYMTRPSFSLPSSCSPLLSVLCIVDCCRLVG